MANATRSVVNGIVFPYDLSDNDSFLKQSGYSLLAKLKFRWKVSREEKAADLRLQKTLEDRECYYGPFKGEMGHFLAHTLPFLMYLHKNKVRIHYCGMGIHKAYFVDENGDSILASYHELRDFFHEVSPSSNSVVPPTDVLQDIEVFKHKAVNSGKSFWNIGDDFYYWFVHRHWLGKGYTHLYDLSKVYKSADEKAICIFPRSKGAKSSHNNGEAWDYQRLVEQISPLVDKIYVVGHPSQSLALTAGEKVELRITSDNSKIIEAVSNSKLIITQHSGINNLGEYARKQVLIIYKGGNNVSDIGSMNNTLLFRNYLNEKFPLAFAFSEKEILDYINKLFNETY